MNTTAVDDEEMNNYYQGEIIWQPTKQKTDFICLLSIKNKKK